MEFELLYKFLNGLLPPDRFAAEISDEIELFKKAFKKKGTSRPVYLFNKKNDYKISHKEIVTLCNAFLSGHISDWHLYYVCDALLLSEAVKDEAIFESISSMTDPDVNGEIDKNLVLDIKKKYEE